MKDRIALIPSYEPDEALLKVVDELLANSFKVVVVNDGSNVTYNHIFEQLPIMVHYLHYETNMGKGFALKHGLQHIRMNFDPDSIVVTLDSDGQHKVKDAIRVCDLCEEKGGLVLGSRHFDKGTPFKSRFGNWMSFTIESSKTFISYSYRLPFTNCIFSINE